jgi:O-antigen ligase
MSSENSILTHPVSQFFYYAVLSTIPYFYWRQVTPFIPVDWYLALITSAIVVIYLITSKKLPPFFYNNLNKWLILFLLVNILATFFSPYQEAAFSGMIVLFQIYFFIYLNLVFLTKYGLQTILPLVLGISVGFNGLIAGLDYFIGIQLFVAGETGGVRAYGLTSGANNMAVWSIMAIPPLIYKFMNATSSGRFFGWLSLSLLAIVGLISSESRAGFLVFLIMLMMVLYMNRGLFQPRFLGLAISGVGLCFLMVAVAIPDDYFERQKTLLAEDQNQDASLQRRKAYVRVGLASFFENPILGTGTFTFPQVWVNSIESRFFKMTERGAHNTYLDIMVGLGVVGLLVLLGLFFRIFKDFMNALSNFEMIGDEPLHGITQAYLVSFVCLVVYCLFKTMLDNKMFILLISISQVVYILSSEKKEQVHGYAG